MPDLHALRLDSNKLVDFGQAFVNLRFLLMLNISSNRISSFDYAQIPLGLQWLDLHSNKIDKLNNYYYTPSAQQQFSASNDILSQQNSIGQQWQSMLRLTTLDVSHNLIRELDNTSLPESLETVQLNNNHIKTIASLTFSTKSNLTRINLSHNQLTTLPFDALKLNNNRDTIQPQLQLQQQKFVDVYLANNPFVCNCNMGWFSNLLLASTNPFQGGVIPASIAGNVRDQTFVNIYAQMTARQLPRVADAQLVSCQLPFGRQTSQNSDPHTWSPVLAANQLALQQNHHHSSSHHNQPLILRQLELLQSVHLCPYKHHCFALCNCCEFDACDCEMSCPDNCSCYYDQKWNVNIVDCSANNQVNGNPQVRFTQMMMGVNGASSYHYNHHHNHHRQQAASASSPQLIKFSNIPEKIPMDVTDLFLDGLELNQLRTNALIGRKYLKSLYLNNSQLHSIESKALNTQRSLRILQLNSNFLTDLFGFEFEQQVELRELYLANNRLRTIADTTFTPLKSLQILHLQNNQLYNLNLWSNIPTGVKLNSINLGQNPWSCQCDYIEPMLTWLQANIKSVYDRKSVSCLHERSTYLHLISPHATESSLVPMIYGSAANNENYPIFTKDMCLNYTVRNQQPVTENELSGEPKSGDFAATGLSSYPTSSPDSYDEITTTGNNFMNHQPNDEPPRLPPSGGIEYPPDSSPRTPVSVINLSIGVTLMMVTLVIIIMTFTHYRRRMGVWFYSNYGLSMFSAGGKPQKHPTSNSIGKHHHHHPHLNHQYGVGSSAGSTSSSSAASSNMSHALCQPQSTNGSTGLVTTPLIVSSSNQAIMNSTAPYQDDDRLFDAYLTYSKLDEQFINDYIAPELECSPPAYR